MAGSMCTFSTAGASRQSVISKRLGRRSAHTLGPVLALNRARGGLSRRHIPRLLLDGVDVTPMPLLDGAPDDRPPVTTAWELLAGLSAVGVGVVPGLRPAPSACSGIAVTRDSSVGSSLLALGHGGALGGALTHGPDSSALSVFSDDPAPSQFALPRVPSPTVLPPCLPDAVVTVVLNETRTLSLHDVAPTAAPADSDEGLAIQLDNARVAEQHAGRASRTFAHVEVQTSPVWTRSRDTNLARARTKNAAVQASAWDIFDTGHGASPSPQASPASTPQQAAAPAKPAQPSPAERRALQRRRRMLRRSVLDRISSQRSLSLSDADAESARDNASDVASHGGAGDDPAARGVLLLPAFRRAAMQVERILAASSFAEQQALYRGVPAADPLAADLRFEYRLVALWRLECEWAAGRAVTALAWNPHNADLLAVAYGKYLQQDQATGLVCMWSSKNPLLPERLYRFASPVTALAFCPSRPNLLAVGSHNGGLALLDVSSQEKTVVADAGVGSASRAPSPSWEPVWAATWMSGQEFHLDDGPVLVTAGQDGRVLRWRRGDRGLEWASMLRVPVAQGGEQGVQPLLGASAAAPEGLCPRGDVGLRQFTAVLSLQPVPRDPVGYLVATEDGCVHVCSTNYLDRHVSVLVAHAGPVYRLSFSPFCEKIFLTCGADWTVRLWAVGVGEPLVTLTGGMQAVEDAAWSPHNSTVIASASGDEVCLWDLRRKTYVPASRTPCSSAPTALTFCPTQNNLLVADREGRVEAFALRDMPFAPYFQAQALAAALERALATKPALLAALRKLGQPFAP